MVKIRWPILMIVLGPVLAFGVATGLSTAAIHATGSTILYVKESGSGDCSDWAAACQLQTALGAATYGDGIWVMTGLYTPTTVVTDREATFELQSGVALYGGFAGDETSREDRNWESNITVLSGDIDANDTTNAYGVVTTTASIAGGNSYHVVMSSGVTETCVLDGFTITAGKANGPEPDDSAAGMYNIGSSPTVRNVTFSGNFAAIRGGAVFNEWISDTSSSPTLTNVTFDANRANFYGGAVLNYRSSPTLTNAIFSGNFAQAMGAGMYSWGNSQPVLVNAIFSANYTKGLGGGLYNSRSSPTLVNVVFSANTADQYGGAIHNHEDSNPTLTNCILWANTAPSGPQIRNYHSSPTVTYSLVQGGHSGTGNIDQDPQFVDADGPDDVVGTLDDNLRLKPTSPAIDAGDNSAVPADTFDLDGDADTSEVLPNDLDGYARFVDIPGTADTGVGPPPVVDMGAHEARVRICLPLLLRSYAH